MEVTVERVDNNPPPRPTVADTIKVELVITEDEAKTLAYLIHRHDWDNIKHAGELGLCTNIRAALRDAGIKGYF